MRIELIVVDDVSPDGTSAILEGLQRELGFTLIKQPKNGGKGSALGALLVLWVGNRTFARVVPWLIYGATVLFLAQVCRRRS